jgi:hypothetical protein
MINYRGFDSVHHQGGFSRQALPGGFLALNLYSMGLSAVVAYTLIGQHFKRQPELLELAVADPHGKILPLGTVARLGANQ